MQLILVILLCTTSIDYTKILGVLEVLAALVRVKVAQRIGSTRDISKASNTILVIVAGNLIIALVVAVVVVVVVAVEVVAVVVIVVVIVQAIVGEVVISPFGAPGWKPGAGACFLNSISAKFSPKNVRPQLFIFWSLFTYFKLLMLNKPWSQRISSEGTPLERIFCNRLGAGSLSQWSLLRTIFGLKVAHRFSFDRVFLQGSTFFPPIRWTLKFWEVYLGRLDEDGFAKLRHSSFVVCLGTLVQDGLAHMRGVICSGKVQNTDVWDDNFRIWSL